MKNLLRNVDLKRLVVFAVTAMGILFLAYGNVIVKNIGMYVILIIFIVFYLPLIIDNDRVANFLWKREPSKNPNFLTILIIVAVVLYLITLFIVMRILRNPQSYSG